MSTIFRCGFTVLATRHNVGTEKPTALGVVATYKLLGRRKFWGKSGDFCRVDVRESTVGTKVTRGAREPGEAASGVHDESEGLRRSSEAKRDGIATITVRKKWSLEERRCNVGFGFSFGFRVRVFEMLGSCD